MRPATAIRSWCFRDSAPVMRTYGEPLFHTDSELAALAYAPNGTLWSVEEAGWLRGWSATGTQLSQHLLNDLETLWAFSPDAAYVASASSKPESSVACRSHLSGKRTHL